jgi:dienelactone hydrolase
MRAMPIVVGAALGVLGLAAGAAAEYANPTPGAQVALQIPGMHRASVLRDIVYARRGGVPLRLDVYRPHGADPSKLLAAVLLVHGRTSDPSPKDWGIYVGWGQLLAAHGLAGIPFNHRGTPADVRAALAFVRRHGARLGVDATRLCVASFSAGVPIGMQVALTDGHLRCALAFYGPADPGALAADSPPTLIAKAGLDDPAAKSAIDAYVARARMVGAEVRLLVHPRGRHGFDALDHDARSRAILRAALRFAQARLQ